MQSLMNSAKQFGLFKISSYRATGAAAMFSEGLQDDTMTPTSTEVLNLSCLSAMVT